MKNIFVIVSLSIFIISCKHQQESESITSFSMSNTMMSKCEFYGTKNEQVKNEKRFFGKIEADNNRTAQVSSVMSGVVKSIQVALGDYVEQGQVMAVIQSSEVATFQQEKLDATNDVAIAEKNLQVAKDLFAGKLNSEKDVAVAEKELEKARAGLERINEIYKIYSLKGGSTFQVIAPISGFVITKNININELLRSDEENPLFTIADINEIWAVANVNESDISKIKEGYVVSINTIAYPDTVFEGKIEKIYNLVDKNTKSMKFRVRLKNPNYILKPDMNCTVTVSYSEDKILPTIPSSSVIFDKNNYWVMVFKDQHNVETRKIEVYRQLNNITYIQSGLNEGEKVISKNGILIYDALND
ncbi:MAG: efflux RND transporter periplasmic adaptor subunit [Bacteroidia bacterium]|nr:efflux RND transporter periplasmic adaptor subunit [Bacteroidia bacterium]